VSFTKIGSSDFANYFIAQQIFGQFFEVTNPTILDDILGHSTTKLSFYRGNSEEWKLN
jgi:hypothetical protein